MLRVGILGRTDSARRKAEIVARSESALLIDGQVDPRELIEASDLIVLTDGDSVFRSELATLALRRGRHVFSDWPVVPDAASARKLSQTAEESGVQIACNRPDRLHPVVQELRSGAPTLTDVTLTAGLHYRFENLLMDAVDLCLFLSGGSGIHKYEAEAVRNDSGATAALSFALRFHSGSLALGHLRKSDGLPVRTIFAAGNGWVDHRDLLEDGDPSDSIGYNPSTDERPFESCLERLGAGQSVQTSLYELEETMRSVGNIMTRTRGL